MLLIGSGVFLGVLSWGPLVYAAWRFSGALTFQCFARVLYY